MKVIVSGQHMRVGESLKSHVEQKMVEHVKKYFDRAITGLVTLTMERPHYIRTDILINEGSGKGLLIKSSAHDNEAYRSFDEALIKVEKQLRKHKSRIKTHQKGESNKLSYIEAKKYVISPYLDDEEDIGEAPAIIAEKVTGIETLTVGEAVMRMDLENLPTYVFTNSGTKRLNVIYYRADGNISWIDIPK